MSAPQQCDVRSWARDFRSLAAAPYGGAPQAACRIIWGCRVGRLEPNTFPNAVRHITCEMLHAFSELKNVSVTHAWDGLIGYTYGEPPCLGRTSWGIHYALGCRGSDVSRATYFGAKWELSRQAMSFQNLRSVQ